MSGPAREDSKGPPSLDDVAQQKQVFAQAFEQTCKLLDDPKFNIIQALFYTHRGRDEVLNRTVQTHAQLSKAECQKGCAACCYKMVMCTPFEILSIALHLLTTKTPEEVEIIKGKLALLAPLPIDPYVRHGMKNACPLLEDNQCSIYEHRPSACRTMLSTSRAACEQSLRDNTGAIPFIVDPSKLATIVEMGIDLALLRRTKVSTERVELSRALLSALSDFTTVLAQWANGQDPFKDSQRSPPGYASNRDMVERAAKYLNVG